MVKHSDVYINKFEVSKARDRCHNQTELARALMKVVFTETALKTCSMFGKKPKGFGKTDKVKPALNENGIEAILSMFKMNIYSLSSIQINFSTRQITNYFFSEYVKRHGEELNWSSKSRQEIIRSMTSKLGEMQSVEKKN